MKYIKLYCLTPVLLSLLISMFIHGGIDTGRYFFLSLFYYVPTLFMHSLYFLVGFIIYKLDSTEDVNREKSWVSFNFPILVVVFVIDLILYYFGDLEGDINNNGLYIFISNNVFLILWILFSLLYKYNNPQL